MEPLLSCKFTCLYKSLALSSLYIPFVYLPNDFQKSWWFCVYYWYHFLNVSIGKGKSHSSGFFSEIYSITWGLLLLILHFSIIVLIFKNIQLVFWLNPYYIYIFIWRGLASALVKLSYSWARMVFPFSHLTSFIWDLDFFSIEMGVHLVSYLLSL